MSGPKLARMNPCCWRYGDWLLPKQLDLRSFAPKVWVTIRWLRSNQFWTFSSSAKCGSNLDAIPRPAVVCREWTMLSNSRSCLESPIRISSIWNSILNKYMLNKSCAHGWQWSLIGRSDKCSECTKCAGRHWVRNLVHGSRACLHNGVLFPCWRGYRSYGMAWGHCLFSVTHQTLPAWC